MIFWSFIFHISLQRLGYFSYKKGEKNQKNSPLVFKNFQGKNYWSELIIDHCHWVTLIQILSFWTLRDSVDGHISNETGPPVVSHAFLLRVKKKTQKKKQVAWQDSS